MGHNSLVFIVVVFFSALWGVVHNSVVKVRYDSYPCSKKTISFNQTCEITWTINGKNIAHYKDQQENSCISPCQKIEDGLMTLDSLVDVNMTTNCLSKMTYSEDRVIFLSKLCSGLPPNPSFEVWLLLVASIVGFF